MNKMHQKTVLQAFPAWVSPLPALPCHSSFPCPRGLHLWRSFPVRQSANAAIFRHPEPDKWSIIQQRNVLRARVEYDWIKNGQAFSRFSLPGIDYAHFVGLYRGVYDSVYDFQPGPRQDVFPYRGRAGRDGKLSELSHKAAHALRFESTFREVFTDIEFAKLPLSLRIGRQMVVWGESDNLRMLDRTNALDTTWHGAASVRKPGTTCVFRTGCYAPPIVLGGLGV